MFWKTKVGTTLWHADHSRDHRPLVILPIGSNRGHYPTLPTMFRARVVQCPLASILRLLKTSEFLYKCLSTLVPVGLANMWHVGISLCRVSFQRLTVGS